MNPDTLVAVSCYSGDQQRVANALDLYLHHECPVVTLSPDDAPAKILHPRVENWHGGKNSYDGQKCLDKYDEYLGLMLKSPYKHFLFHDSDSLCLTPELPRCFYEEPDVFWSFNHPEGRPHESPYPKIAFQPPMFFSRAVIERLWSVDRTKVPCHPITPYPDWFFVALACEAGVLYKQTPNSVSFPGWNGGGANANVAGFVSDASYRGGDRMFDEVLNGATFLHAVRHPDVLQRVRDARRAFLKYRS
jgi:hypothetical protein